jgi:hypothetical protein
MYEKVTLITGESDCLQGEVAAPNGALSTKNGKANLKRTCYFVIAIDEGRRKLIYLVAGMFLVRRLAGLNRRPSPASENAFRDAIDNAVELMRRISCSHEQCIQSASWD